jgi:hypothetical protein
MTSQDLTQHNDKSSKLNYSSAASNLSKLHSSNLTSSASKSKSGLNGLRAFYDSSASMNNSKEGELTTPYRKTLSICDETESLEIDFNETPDSESNKGPRMFDAGLMPTHAPSLPISVNTSTYTTNENDRYKASSTLGKPIK